MLCIYLQVRSAIGDSNGVVFDEPGRDQKFCNNLLSTYCASPWKVSRKEEAEVWIKILDPYGMSFHAVQGYRDM